MAALMRRSFQNGSVCRETKARGMAVLAVPPLNKGTAFAAGFPAWFRAQWPQPLSDLPHDARWLSSAAWARRSFTNLVLSPAGRRPASAV